MIFNLVGKESQDPSDISDLNVTSKDIMKDKVSISKDGTSIVGEAPFEYLGTEDGIDNYRVLEDEMHIILPNSEKKLLKTEYITVDDEWTQTTSASNYCISVCYGNGKYVAVTYDAKAAYSTDGINWTLTTLPVFTTWESVCYGNGKFVAITNGGNNIAAYSTDGITWTQTTLPANVNWQSVCYGNGKYVALANSTNIAAYSTDGITWTQMTMPTSAGWFSVCYGDGKYVAVNYNSNKAAYSTDGINWTQITLPASVRWYSVCYGDGKFVTIANDSNIAAYAHTKKYSIQMLN